MNNADIEKGRGFFGGAAYLALAALAAIPIFILTHAYTESIRIHEDEAVATASTACFIVAVFTGRYIGQLWLAGRKTVSNTQIAGLLVLIIVCSSWIFFHNDFPLQDSRAGINLFLFLLPAIIVSLALGMLAKLVRGIARKQLEEARAGEAHSKSELHLLQSQISPHFLFNTLNNLYGLSITQHEKVPPMLLKLSELLRYSVYDATELYVPLKEEMAYINNYIEFEKIRIGDRLMLTTEFEEVENDAIKIAPMLLIVFIENAFKHSKNTAAQKIFINISIRTWGNLILFSVKNSQCSEKPEPGLVNKSSGFGLNSVKRRLELLYENGHDLSIKDEPATYQVMLQLKKK